ncbi:aspartate aminotransferase family protein [Fulvivirga sp. M361]|uniref:pyridoxal phosphate-dependent decarboxylase family protein n=1 Tax=Fulvivirga sp. M361 TaxID=2594266 RepID=UPI00117A2604|nr:aminotransferase class I/II-fold pyridoxal phosphate-dependent enzyme [Fulvivirga sp. M361]TRX58778.1 aspartate aminotransferase family protein [Fulvivirga sp. M361]
MFDKKEIEILQKSLSRLQEGFSLPKWNPNEKWGDVEKILLEVARKMQNNYPYFHPQYAGQMLKPPHAVARMAYALAMYINPNNHALDGSKASSPMEKEAVSQMAEMFGWKNYLGHLTGGGTIANMEALWVAGKVHPEKKIVASELSHYTHERISGVLGLPFEKVACDTLGRMHLKALEDLLLKGDVGTVVVTLGTTGTGSVDPLTDILELQKVYGFRIHIDAAYGGYFTLSTALDNQVKEHFNNISYANSIVVDPHKHGLQPYGCGCILFKDPEVGRFYKHDSPYTYFTSAELHLGEISLECSRAGASAVALWATLQLFPLTADGPMGQGMNNCHKAAMDLYSKITDNNNFVPLHMPETDIVIWAPKDESLSQISKRSKALFQKCAAQNIHLALFNYPTRLLPDHWGSIKKDREQVTCLRSSLMKWEHVDWVDRIWEIVEKEAS